MKPSLLLGTKFTPPPNAGALPRPHLIQKLDEYKDRRLILISAPPGYGKTTLLAEFLTFRSGPFAWYQLDSSDSDPTVFLTYLIEAIRRAKFKNASKFGQDAQSLLNRPEASADAQRILTVLINELTEQGPDQFLITLEDYHVIKSTVVHQLVDYLLENAPHTLHLIISTRADPPLALARLRAHGLLAELRAPDLRFREEEVSELFKREMPNLSVENLSMLSEKTEGWVAGLQIVRNSLAGQNENAAREIITSLSGSHRFVFEYLAEEVFLRQSNDKQKFLLHTAILSQMDAASCNFMAGIKDSQGVLEELEKQNLFLTSLDSERRWYRYHFLFREFLLSRLRHEFGEQSSSLEGSAGKYYEERNEWEQAFLHFVAAQDFSSAARVALKFASDYAERGRVEVLHRYLHMLPPEILRAHPELLLQDGNAHRRLGEAGRAIIAYEDAHIAFDQQKNPSGKSRAITCLAELYRSQGNYRQAEVLSTQALESAPPDDHNARAEALMALAKSAGFLGGMDRGRDLAEQAVEESRKADGLSAPKRASFLQSLGQICWWHGDPQSAAQHTQEALSLVPDQMSPIAAQAFLLLATIHLYWREFEPALKYAERGLEISQVLHLTELLPSAYTALGNVLTRLGETPRAEAVLRQAVELAQGFGIASYERVMAIGYLAYNLSSQGRTDEAWQLAEGALWAYTGNRDSYEAVMCQGELADIALEKKHLGRAENLFEELLQSGTRRQFKVLLALAYFGLAYIHLVTDRKETGLQHARAAVELFEYARNLQLFVEQEERCHVVCNALIEAGYIGPFLERSLEHLPDRKKKKQTIAVKDKSVITIKSMGLFSVFIEDQEITQDRWVSAKARDLLAYFITFRGERVTADRAFDAIWSEKAGRGLTAFHTALSRLRNALKTGERSPRLILVETGEYRLDAARFNIDVDEFDSALAKARAASDDEIAAHFHEQAVSLYRGEYMQNFYYDWLFPERRRLMQAYINALRALANYHYSHERYARSLEFLDRALRVDPLQEEIYCDALRAHASLGDRAGLIQRYQDLKRILVKELEMEPVPATERLYQNLLRGF